MKPLLSALSLLTLATITGNVNNILYTILAKNNISTKTEQATIYIDENGKEVTTSNKDLSKIKSNKVIQIGYYQNENNQIQVVRMPKTIKEVPKQLPQEITSLKNMFSGSIVFNQDLSSWNTGHVTNMDFMFNGAFAFNANITNWDVSLVTSMYVMFAFATSFNQNIAKWTVSNVKNFSLMFYQAWSFNQNIAHWNTVNADNMDFMFNGASAFNQDLSQWNVEKVTKHDNFSSKSGIDNPNKLPKFKTKLK